MHSASLQQAYGKRASRILREENVHAIDGSFRACIFAS